MTRKEELAKIAHTMVRNVYSQVDRDGDMDAVSYEACVAALVAVLQQVEREVWGKVIAGYLRYKESLVPKPGCEKFPAVLLMSFEEWCAAQQQELG